jgi:hypothetical protein
MAHHDPRESEGRKKMFTGKTIEELINSVERAEEHAREEQRQAFALPELWTTQMQVQELIEVA